MSGGWLQGSVSILWISDFFQKRMRMTMRTYGDVFDEMEGGWADVGVMRMVR